MLIFLFQDLSRILRNDEPGEAGGGAPPAVDPNVAAMAVLQQQIDALKADNERERTRATEQEANTKYWFEKANGQAKAETPIEPIDEEPEIDPIELMSRDGSKGFKTLAQKGGLATTAQVQRMIEERAQQITVEAQLTKDFPQITDTKSDFFKQTSVEYGELTRAGVPHIVAMRQAASNVKLAMLESGKLTPQKEIDERESRAAAAGGDRSRGAGKGKVAGDEESDELSDLQKTICLEMGVSEKSYKERAKAGVVYTGGTRF